MFILFGIPLCILFFGALIAAVPIYFAVRMKRRAQLIAELKLSDVAKLRPGVRKIRGRVRAHEDLLRSPMTKRDCAYYHFLVEEQHTHHTGGRHGGTTTHWVAVVNDRQWVSLTIEDETGDVDVWIDEAEVVLKSAERESSGMFNSPPERLRRLIENRYGRSTQGLLFNKTMRFSESVLEDGARVLVVGEVVENKRGRLGFRKGVAKLVLSDKSEKDLVSHYGRQGILLWVVAGVIGLFTLIAVGFSGFVVTMMNVAGR